ncbi:demethylmenaquinone methyltransferase [Phocicoccus pinnipedialis]|uniref:Demethylmenaquinone methyltransferase n=1 Tax=Phocicoccus pinnipedialis TaxID=110845 RepID=A0A6V7RET7_9BACL|nr:demethylmenaquinone methyltransferase [Jeotgalicoccus pinnipedialis]MBP1939365.1 demethylmenaquinone methyltransferase/2-methoxy-6-polyprenyl-1,4-benzoquinol methylase [Jeotgalicoccus pinnipedialis]CAD2075669.1 Demethylmenaquinone methyltransferase [Jeotgalicoccus pinnipedialis]
MANNRIQTIFNTVSKDYDKMNDIISFKQHNIWRNRTNKEIFVKSDSYILDLCCGTGDWTIQLSEMNKNADVVGLDFSEKMLEVAKHKTKDIANISLVQGDAMNLPYDDKTFDIVTIGFGLRNLPNYKMAIDEVYRVLKPGGQFVILETSNPKNKIVRALFNFYFGRIMPLFGQVIAKSGEEYKWLYESTRDFVSKEELKEMMNKSQFINIKVISHNLGMAATHIGFKQINHE